MPGTVEQQVDWEDCVDCEDWVDSFRDCGRSSGGSFGSGGRPSPPRGSRRPMMRPFAGLRCGRKAPSRSGTARQRGQGPVAWLAPEIVHEQAACYGGGDRVTEAPLDYVIQ